jgi:hypothetical protein
MHILKYFQKRNNICPNKSNNNSNYNSNSFFNKPNTTKPSYYSNNTLTKKFWTPKFKQPDNSLKVLQGSIPEVKRKYEILTDLIKEYNGKTHGSQSHLSPIIICI